MSTGQLIAALRHTNQPVTASDSLSARARDELIRRNDRRTTSTLARIVQGQGAPSITARQRAAEVLAGAGEHQLLLGTLYRHKGLRTIYLCGLRYNPPCDDLLALLGHADSTWRLTAAYVLANVNCPGAVAALSDALVVEMARKTRSQMIAALGAKGDTSVIPVLLEVALAHGDDRTDRDTVAALRRIVGDDIARKRALYRHRDWRVRRLMVRRSGYNKTDMRYVLRALLDIDPAVHGEALRSLAKIVTYAVWDFFEDLWRGLRVVARRLGRRFTR